MNVGDMVVLKSDLGRYRVIAVSANGQKIYIHPTDQALVKRERAIEVTPDQIQPVKVRQ